MKINETKKIWKWVISMLVNKYPLFDTADCSEGQSGDVWFLGGTFASSEILPGVFQGNVTRSYDLPAGIALFFPIVNMECSTVEGNRQTEAELRACANYLTDFIVTKDLNATVEGVSIENLKHYRVESPLFTFGPLPVNNVLKRFGYHNAIPGTERRK